MMVTVTNTDIPGLAALTWWLRQQVVTFISGRSLQHDPLLLTLDTLLNNQQYTNTLEEVGSYITEDTTGDYCS